MAIVSGIKSLEFALAAANGAIPTTGWVKLTDIEEGGIELTIPPLETVKIRVEDKSGVRYVLPGQTEPPTIVGASINMSIDNANLLFKGEVTSNGTAFKAPTADKIFYLAVRLTSEVHETKQMVWEAPAVAMSAGFKNSVNKAGVLALSFNGEVTTPSGATGEAVSPWGYKFVDAVPEG